MNYLFEPGVQTTQIVNGEDVVFILQLSCVYVWLCEREYVCVRERECVCACVYVCVWCR